ncbi:hypothetical protein [Nocardia salmonicida]|uniref:hypothetical protein n=1 Tax=Nocardia salmonicida TaxID=53431 RepID=UPI0007A41B54|nr:hypothetical protein [Nocardia salmonicida]
MTAMSYLTVDSEHSGVEGVRYVAAHTADTGIGKPFEMAAYVRVSFAGSAKLILDIEDVRLLAERLPDMLMSHDAAEHAAREQAAAIAEVA